MPKILNTCLGLVQHWKKLEGNVELVLLHQVFSPLFHVYLSLQCVLILFIL